MIDEDKVADELSKVRRFGIGEQNSKPAGVGEQVTARLGFGLQGWICPKCGRVFSPFTSMCTYCGGEDRFKVTC